jgi:hypothetical protein
MQYTHYLPEQSFLHRQNVFTKEIMNNLSMAVNSLEWRRSKVQELCSKAKERYRKYCKLD